MKVITETALKDKLSELLQEVEATGEELLVTNNGETVLKVISYRREHTDDETSDGEHDTGC